MLYQTSSSVYRCENIWIVFQLKIIHQVCKAENETSPTLYQNQQGTLQRKPIIEFDIFLFLHPVFNLLQLL